MDSILEHIKKMLGIDKSLDVFDTDVITLINGAFMVVFQLGGIERPFVITGSIETWSDLEIDDLAALETIKNLVYMRTKIVFDPPANSFVLEAYERQIAELEWRLANGYSCV